MIIAISLIIVVLCLAFRSLLLMERRITQLEQRFLYEFNNIKREAKKDVGKNLISGLDKIKEDDLNHLNFLEKSRKAQRMPSPIVSQNSTPNETINSGGELIPMNLTKEEIETLKLFYDK